MRDTERGRDTGRGRSRLHAGSPMWDSIRELQDHALGWRHALNRWATQVPQGKADSLHGAWFRTQSQDSGITTWVKGRCSITESPSHPRTLVLKKFVLYLEQANYMIYKQISSSYNASLIWIFFYWIYIFSIMLIIFLPFPVYPILKPLSHFWIFL